MIKIICGLLAILFAYSAGYRMDRWVEYSIRGEGIIAISEIALSTICLVISFID